MEKNLLKVLVIIFSYPFVCYSQNEEQRVPFLNTEFILSFSNFSESKPRFSVFPNLNYPVFILIGRNNPYLAETGINLRNNGIIYKDSLTHKIRSIAIGIPLKFSLPTKPKVMIGGEFDYNIFFKRKTINGSDKNKETKNVSDEVNAFQPAATAEVIISRDFRIKVSYYINDYFNSNYNKTVDGSIVQPYRNNSNIFYVSLVMGTFFATSRPTIIRIL
jgi:hypothetical protein